MIKKYTDSSFQGFYTNADDIRRTMIHLLGDVEDKKVIEPCFGEGAFIKDLIGKPSLLDAIDIDKAHFNKLTLDYNHNFFNIDFIDYCIGENNNDKKIRNDYDLTICNPPYGLKFSKEYRALIKSKFKNVYARESYGLFFFLTVMRLCSGGRYVFIIPDTFLSSRNFKYLREFMVNDAAPTDILIFKSKRFESVNFGYGGLCIIAGHKRKLHEGDSIRFVDAKDSEKSLFELLNSESFVSGAELIEKKDSCWIFEDKVEEITFKYGETTLGEIAECKTGIYTGDNNRFCGFDKDNPPSRINGHPVDWKLVEEFPSDYEKIHGIDGDKKYVKFVRGGHRKPFELTCSCILWTPESIEYYANDSKARLQNRTFYFKRGLAVPMVTSGRLSASIMENSIFDQGVVGVFPEEDSLNSFLLIYLNSDIANLMKSIIAPGANNSANYLKRIRVPLLRDEDKKFADKIVEKAKVLGWEAVKEIRESFINQFIKADKI